MLKKNIKYDKMNYGLCLLKALLAFEVLLGHFAIWSEYDSRLVWPFRELVSLAVPCFMIISFYFTANSFLSLDDQKFMTRLRKLFIPQLVWAVVYYVIYALIDLFMHKGLHSGPADLFWQILAGHSRFLNASMWYQFDIIVVTVIFYLLFKYLKNDKAYLAMIVLTIVCYILQFTEINRMLFENLEFELKYPLGRIVEMIPFAFIGFSIRRFNLFERIKRFRYLIMPLCVIIFLAGFSIPWTYPDDFGFSGFAKPYLALCIVTFAYMVPLEKLNLTFKKFIIRITDYSLGIYCVHRLINTLLTVFVPSLSLRSFERCIFLYVICYLVCFLIDLIPDEKTKLLIN